MGQVKKPEVRDAILRSALRLFARKDYARTTLDMERRRKLAVRTLRPCEPLLELPLWQGATPAERMDGDLGRVPGFLSSVAGVRFAA